MHRTGSLWCRLMTLVLALVLLMPLLAACDGGGKDPPTAAATRTPTPTPNSSVTRTPAAITGEEVEIFNNGNIDGVLNNPVGPTSFTLTRTYRITLIEDYHWNNGKGASAGTIGLRDSSGKVIGTWNVTVRSNVYWDVRPDIDLGPGTYTVVDSDPSTWSQNAGSSNRGFTIVKGIPIGGTTAAATPTRTPEGRVAEANTQDVGTAGGSVGLKDGAAVVIPAGAIDASAKMTVSKLNSGDAVAGTQASSVTGLVEGATYEIKVGDQREFRQSLTLEIPYDPAKLSGKRPPENDMLAAWWDPDQKIWHYEAVQVDAQRKVAIIRTDHLTVWRQYYIALGYEIRETDHFLIRYDPKVRPSIGRENFSESQDPAAFAQRVGVYLESAWSKYREAGFDMPSAVVHPRQKRLKAQGGAATPTPTATRQLTDIPLAKTWVFIDQKAADSATNTWTANITLKLRFDSVDQLRHDVGHELFHAIQREYFYIPGYVARQWWMEATADYASIRIAWGDIPEARAIRAEYFVDPFQTVDQTHEYETWRFIDYLIGKGVNFKNLWDVMADQNIWVAIASLEQYFKTSKSATTVHDYYRDFAAYVMFDGSGPLETNSARLRLTGLADRNAPREFAAGATEMSSTLSLKGGGTARLWGFTAPPKDPKAPPDLKRQIKIEATGNIPPLNVEANVYLLKTVNNAEQRPAGGVKPEGTIKFGSKSLTLKVGRDQVVYIVAVNTNQGDTSLTLKVSDDAGLPVSAEGSIDKPPLAGMPFGNADNPIKVRLSGKIRGDAGLKFEGTEFYSSYGDYSNVLAFVYSIPANATKTSLDFDDLVVEFQLPVKQVIKVPGTQPWSQYTNQTIDVTNTWSGWGAGSWSRGVINKSPSGSMSPDGWANGVPVTLGDAVVVDSQRDGVGIPWSQAGGTFFRASFSYEVLREYRDLTTGVIGARQRQTVNGTPLVVIRLVRR